MSNTCIPRIGVIICYSRWLIALVHLAVMTVRTRIVMDKTQPHCISTLCTAHQCPSERNCPRVKTTVNLAKAVGKPQKFISLWLAQCSSQ
ncbi:hypothetical protein BDU57DRAFT_515589 [Ampelomyces quisqualis]|uniref:Uncharacterized protein n=1 Tax=Ampelomyces quisqualis TaxID=50730 RepID=A0A6A5QKC3_AMPQU|nr:hypothetical protein BDU57DRAFT_515589 [Ampelomyces quisqualis]